LADIFISYSSKDRAQADQLTELLSSAGLSVWIDKSGIDVATSWSEEIVHAIDNCRAFVLMLSPSSVESHNVIKEVSLASEKKKKILPLDLEPVEIPASMQYALAGLQRSPMTNIDGIIRAIGKLGLEATQAPSMKLVKETDSRKSLMILPFEDLSPTGDNGWFADGIASELISALTNIKSLRIADNQATKEFKSYHGQLSAYAQAMNIRYFVQGDVRKFGDQIKVSSRLLDIETGDHLWQDSMKGTMDDIFDIQEKVAEKIVEGLKIHLVGDEAKKLAKRGTDNAEAYELYLRAEEYFFRGKRAHLEHAIKLTDMALEADPNFAQAMLRRAIIIVKLYREYTHDPQALMEVEDLLRRAQSFVSSIEDWRILALQSKLAEIRGDLITAERLTRENFEIDPNDPQRNDELSILFLTTGRASESLVYMKKVFELVPTYRNAFNLLNRAILAEIPAEIATCALVFIPYAESKLKITPDDEGALAWYTLALYFSGRTKEALAFLETLDNKPIHTPVLLYNVSCIAALLGDNDRAMKWVVRYYNSPVETLQHLYKDLRHDELAPLRGRPEFQALMKDLEEKIASEKHG
jgi:adenylate cyclase